MKSPLLFLLSLLLALPLSAQVLFNGKNLDGWKPAFKTGGRISVTPEGALSCEAGKPMSGVAYTGKPPRMNYEVSLEAMRRSGDDFFIGLTLPVGTNACTVIIGGWGGGVCGISSIDYIDASESPYSEGLALKNEKWYKLCVRVTERCFEVQLDGDLYAVKIPFKDTRCFSLRPGYDIENTLPLGLSTYETHALWRNIRIRSLKQERK